MQTFVIPKLGATEELRGKLAAIFHTIPDSPIDTVFQGHNPDIELLRERGANIYPFHDYRLGRISSRPLLENIVWNEAHEGANAGMLVGTVVENIEHNVVNLRHIQDVSWVLTANYLENKKDVATFREQHLNFVHSVRSMLDHVRSGSTGFYDADMKEIDKYQAAMEDVDWEDNNFELELEVLRHRIVRAVKLSLARAGRIIWHYQPSAPREDEIISFANFILSFYFRIVRGQTGFGDHADTVTFLDGSPSLYARRRPTQLRSQIREALYQNIVNLVLTQTHVENHGGYPINFGEQLRVNTAAFYKWYDLLTAIDPSRAGITAASAETEPVADTTAAADDTATPPPAE